MATVTITTPPNPMHTEFETRHGHIQTLRWIGAAILLLAGGTADAQTMATVGSRVRFTTSESARWVTGVVREVSRDSIQIGGGAYEGRRFATRDLRELQVSFGRNHLAGMGAGFLLGGGIGGLGGAAIALRESGGDSFIPPGYVVAFFAIEGAALGALLGGLVGTEQWHPGALSVTRLVTASPGHLGLRLAWPR